MNVKIISYLVTHKFRFGLRNIGYFLLFLFLTTGCTPAIYGAAGSSGSGSSDGSGLETMLLFSILRSTGNNSSDNTGCSFSNGNTTGGPLTLATSGLSKLLSYSRVSNSSGFGSAILVPNATNGQTVVVTGTGLGSTHYPELYASANCPISGSFISVPPFFGGADTRLSVAQVANSITITANTSLDFTVHMWCTNCTSAPTDITAQRP